MVTLRFKDSGAFIGSISDEEFQYLVDDLEEESLQDTDYFVNTPTIDMLEEDGAPESLVKLLRSAVGNGDGVEIRWERQ